MYVAMFRPMELYAHHKGTAIKQHYNVYGTLYTQGVVMCIINT